MTATLEKTDEPRPSSWKDRSELGICALLAVLGVLVLVDAVRIPTDSRFLVNPTRGKGFYATAFHEYGHSLKAVNIDVGYPILRGYEWIPGAQCAAYEEGVAELHAEFTEDSAWIADYSATPRHVVEEYAAVDM